MRMPVDILLLMFCTLVASVALTACARFVARKYTIVDVPGSARKIHKTPTPLLGGVAVIGAFVFGVLLAWPSLVHGYLLPKHLLGVVVGAFILLVGGVIDDKFNLSPKKQILFPLLACVVIIASGIGIDYISNPLGGVLRLDNVNITLFRWNDLPYSITLLADLFTVLWLMGMMYTTKFLDGLDGLVSGVTVIGCGIVFWLSISQTVYQPETAAVALIAGAAFLGFLFFNTHPASIFLGESGSVFAGFILGVLAIISGGKIATALLIMGIPILDVLWVISRRLFFEKRSPFQADRKHLHLRLVDVGLSQRKAVAVLYLCTLAFGASSLFLESKQKMVALVLVIVVMCAIGGYIVWNYKRKQS